MPLNQRWRNRVDSYRPNDPINTRNYEVALVEESAAKAFVVQHHYAKSFPAGRLSVGLFRHYELVGVGVFSQPMNNRTVTKWAGPDAVGCELGRFVLLDDVPGNGESWFLARARKLLRRHKEELEYIVSFSDPLERTNDDGVLVKPGHMGTIYQASNAKYCGTADANTQYFTREGLSISKRTISKVRAEESGYDYAYEQLLRAGAPERHSTEPAQAYLDRVLASGVLRRVRHPGNHVYVFGVHKTITNAHRFAHMPAEKQYITYPKADAA